MEFSERNKMLATCCHAVSFSRTPEHNQGSNTGYATPSLENLIFPSFLLKDLMSVGDIFFLRNTEGNMLCIILNIAGKSGIFHL